MARGQQAKSEITNKILSTFEGSFLYSDGKEIRVPITENGEEVQIKITLTCAKENVAPGADNAIPGTTTTTSIKNEVFDFKNSEVETAQVTQHIAPTAAEKANVKSLLEYLNL